MQNADYDALLHVGWEPSDFSSWVTRENRHAAVTATMQIRFGGRLVFSRRLGWCYCGQAKNLIRLNSLGVDKLVLLVLVAVGVCFL